MFLHLDKMYCTASLIKFVVAQSISHVRLFVTLWTVACQPPPSMGFSRQEYWSGLQFPSLGSLPNPGIEPESPASSSLAHGFFTTEPPGKPSIMFSSFNTSHIETHMYIHTYIHTPVHAYMLATQSCPTLCIPCTVAHQAPLSMEFSRLEHCIGQPFSSPADLPNPGIKPRSPELQADSLPSELPRNHHMNTYTYTHKIGRTGVSITVLHKRMLQVQGC